MRGLVLDLWRIRNFENGGDIRSPKTEDEGWEEETKGEGFTP